MLGNFAHPRYDPLVGDTTAFGWAATFFYFLTAYSAFRNVRAGVWIRPADRRAWSIVCVFQLALGLNKQLDIQSWFQTNLHNLVLYFKAYQYHGTVQVMLFYAGALFAVFSGLLAVPVFIKASALGRAGFIGLGIEACYAVFRAAHFQGIARHPAGSPLLLLEPLALLVILVASLRYAARVQAMDREQDVPV